MKHIVFSILSSLFLLSSVFAFNETNYQRYYPLNVGDNWEYFLGDSTEKATMKFTIVSVDSINGFHFVTTKQEWFKRDSFLYKQEYLQTVDNGFVITAMKNPAPMFQIQHPCDGTFKFSTAIYDKYAITLSEDQKEHLLSYRAAFSFIDFESGTHSMWEFRNKKEVSKFAENVGMVYLKNEKIQLTLKTANVKGKTFKLLQ